MNNFVSDYLSDQLRQLRAEGKLRTLNTPYATQGTWLSTSLGRRLNLSGNDYLALAERRDLQEAFTQAYPEYTTPCGSTSSRLLMGNYTQAADFEREIAVALEHPRALLFNSGYHANSAILPTLANVPGVKVYADRYVHASIIDGIRLSRLPFTRFAHNNTAQLRQQLQDEATRYPNPIVVVESLYSMDGDWADLLALVQLKKDFPQLMIYCDEAHAIGTHGACGYGRAEQLGVLPYIDFLVGTLGKALNGMGAWVATSEEMYQWLINQARPLIFSTMLPPAVIAWGRFIFSHLPYLHRERIALQQVSDYLREALRSKGYPTPGEAHIQPVILGDNHSCCHKAEQLQEAGFEVRPIRYPTVPQGEARLRLSLTAAITPEMLNPLINLL